MGFNSVFKVLRIPKLLLQHYNITTLQHYNITTLQHYNITILQHYNITFLLLFEPSVVLDAFFIHVHLINGFSPFLVHIRFSWQKKLTTQWQFLCILYMNFHSAY